MRKSDRDSRVLQTDFWYDTTNNIIVNDKYPVSSKYQAPVPFFGHRRLPEASGKDGLFAVDKAVQRLDRLGKIDTVHLHLAHIDHLAVLLERQHQLLDGEIARVKHIGNQLEHLAL